MEPVSQWQPQRHLAALMGLFAALCVVFVDIGADASFSSTVERAVGAALIAAVIGYAIGWTLRWLIRETPEPESEEDYLSVPAELSYLRAEDGKSRSGDRSTSEPEEEPATTSADAAQKEEEIMITERT